MASRRQINVTDESAYSVGSSVARDTDVAHRYFAAAELEKMPDDAVLHRSLRIQSIISASSSFARRARRAVSRPDLQQINQIGQGLQGAIFEQVGFPPAIKKEAPGNETKPSSLRHEYAMHSLAVAAFGTYGHLTGGNVRVPRLFDFIESADEGFWVDFLPKVPEGYRARGTVVKMERILPLPKVVRRALVSQFYPRPTPELPLSTAAIDDILNVPENKHCLARTYLGNFTKAFTAETFSLRNIPLSLASMQRLGLDVEELATLMGQAFAIMHWGAGINGDDVEFVLGTTSMEEVGSRALDFQHREVLLFLLDFGQCDSVDLSEEDADVVYQAFKGAMITGDNQYFIPHFQKTPEVFAAFEKAYIEVGQTIVMDKQLANKFNMQEFMNEYREYAEDFLY